MYCNNCQAKECPYKNKETKQRYKVDGCIIDNWRSPDSPYLLINGTFLTTKHIEWAVEDAK